LAEFQTDHPDQIATARKEGIAWYRSRKLCAERSDLIGCIRDAELARIEQLQAVGSSTVAVSRPTGGVARHQSANAKADTIPDLHAPALDNSVENSLNRTLAHPGAGPAGEAFMYKTLANIGVTDPYKQQFLREAGPYASPASESVGTSQVTVLDALRTELKREYPGNSEEMRLRRANALNNLSRGEITMHQAEAFLDTGE
jgi:hypothetical protein